MKIDLSCPSEVWRCRLIDKEGTGAEVTLNNLADKPVTSTEVTLVLHGRDGDESSRVLFRAHDLYAHEELPDGGELPVASGDALFNVFDEYLGFLA